MSFEVSSNAIPVSMIDLHSHSTASDGSVKPAGIVRMAMEKHLKAIALTDHDTIDGLPEFLETALREAPGLEAIPGIELAAAEPSAPHRGYHILGLYLQGPNDRMLGLLQDVLRWRNERNLRMLDRLREGGCPLTMEEVVVCAGGGVIGRPHFAQAMVKRGYVAQMHDAFDRWLATGKPGYVHRQVPSPLEAIAAIHSMGGLAIWAHPFTRGNYTVTQIRHTAVELKNAGLDGMEAYYSLHTPTQQRNALAIAAEVGLLVTGGSDFHGLRFRRLDLGTGYGTLQVPDNLLGPLHDALKKN